MYEQDAKRRKTKKMSLTHEYSVIFGTTTKTFTNVFTKFTKNRWYVYNEVNVNYSLKVLLE